MGEGILPRSIVVGVDGAGRSDHAVRAALDLATRFDAEVELVHAVRVPPALWPKVDTARLAAMNGEALDRAYEHVSQHLEPILGETSPVRTCEELLRVQPGLPTQAIIDRAIKVDANLIVLGEHERRMPLDLGSTARAVLALAPVAVWVQQEQVRPIDRILVPVDLSEDSLLALNAAVAIANKLGASVRVLHVFSSPEFDGVWPDYPVPYPTYTTDQIRESTRSEFDGCMGAVDWRGVEHEVDMLDGDPVAEIIKAGEQADLIALGSHGRTGLSRTLLGNVAGKVIAETHRPVLAIRHPERKFLTD